MSRPNDIASSKPELLDRVKKVLNKAGIADDSIACGIHLPPRGSQIVAEYVGISTDDVPLLVMELSLKLKAKSAALRRSANVKGGGDVPSGLSIRVASNMKQKDEDATDAKVATFEAAKATTITRGQTTHERLELICRTCADYVGSLANNEISAAEYARVELMVKLMNTAIDASKAMASIVPEEADQPALAVNRATRETDASSDRRTVMSLEQTRRLRKEKNRESEASAHMFRIGKSAPDENALLRSQKFAGV